ncbi:MAG: inorganic phosphate transporter, partial [Ruminococcaceae bacterium]|nr:inorganic phosphate transporter [Oscillospiraceae bacterium]
GTLLTALTSSRVANTLYRIADFGDEPKTAFACLCAGLCATVIWALSALRFGIPTSESHALISGISGAAVACRHSFSALQAQEWLFVAGGLFLSTLPAILLGRLLYSLICRLCQSYERRRMMRTFRRAQILGAASGALMHGLQDSQKFMGVFMLGVTFLQSGHLADSFSIPFSVVLLCASALTLGTMLGGGRIIRKISVDMVRLDAVGGSAADMATSVVLAVCSIAGMPVSTTHAKACAMMGVGSRGQERMDGRVIMEIAGAWLLTFPCCFLLGYALSFLLM